MPSLNPEYEVSHQSYHLSLMILRFTK